MKSGLLKFFSIQRQIFGLCPCCGDIFRLSDAKLYLKDKPKSDWMDKLHKAEERLDKQENKINEERAEISEISRIKGRNEALKSIKKIDTIFHPNNLSADDAKVMFHPVDFVVFNGMKISNEIEITLLDRVVENTAQKALQRSIEKTVEKQNYEWITIHVGEEGEIEYK